MKRSTLLKTSICGAAAIATHVGLMHAIPSGTHDRSELIEGGRIAVQLVSASVTTSSPAPAPQAATEKARSETEAPPPTTTKPAPAAP
ncbi:MAG: hypothetical protein CME89_11405, partial [Hirschia sp.]|nr:hypothetical protein [Hirschia sp.]